MNQNTRNVHEAKCASEGWSGSWCSENEHDGGTDEWGPKMSDSVRKPGKDIQSCVLVLGQDIGQIGAVQDILESWKDSDPNVWSIYGWNEPALVRILVGFNIRRKLLTCKRRRITAMFQ